MTGASQSQPVPNRITTVRNILFRYTPWIGIVAAGFLLAATPHSGLFIPLAVVTLAALYWSTTITMGIWLTAGLVYALFLLRAAEPAILDAFGIWILSGAIAGLILQQRDRSRQLISQHMADEERLQTLDRQIRLILRTIPEQFWLKDRDGRYLLVSEALAQFHGLSSEAMIGRSAHDLSPIYLADFIAVGDTQVFEHGQNYYAERLIPAPDGTKHWFDSSRTPVYDDDGNLIGLVGLARDISRRKADEADLARQLRYAEALARCSQVLLSGSTAAKDLAPNVAAAIVQLRSAMDVSRVVVYQYGPIEAQAQISRLAEAMAADDPAFVTIPVTWGQSPPELLATLNERRAFGGPTAGRFSAYPQFQAMFDQNQIQSWLAVPIFVADRLWGHIGVSECRYPREWDARLVQLLTTAGEMIAAFVRRLETLEALRRRESHLQAIRDAMPDTLFTLHVDGRLSDLHLAPDSRLVHTSEWSDQSIIESMLATASLQTLKDTAATALQIQTVQQCELASGNPADPAIYEARLAPISTIDVLVVLRDVTERQQVAEQLRQAALAAAAADRAKSAFLAHMSHEIRTPLNAVIGMAELLRRSNVPAGTQAALETIVIGGETLLGIVNDILDLARIESGHLDIDRQPFDVWNTIETSITLMRLRAEEKGLDLQMKIAPTLPRYMLGDTLRLRQILVNLLANAIKFTPQGYVALETEYAADTNELTILVRDSGIGIAADQLEAIFAPFMQTDGHTGRQMGGSGLGLSISRQLASLMGGSLSVTSTLGTGSTFRLHLPVSPSSPPTTEQQQTVYFRRPNRLLVVEDNPINQMVISGMLEQLDCRADIVSSGEEALVAMEQSLYDVILMDIQLPGMNGVETTQAIRARSDSMPQPRIIALTASAIAGDRDRYLAAGLDGYLSKPVRLDQLRNMLNLAPPERPDPINWAYLNELAMRAGQNGAVQLRRLITLFDEIFPQQLDELAAVCAELDRHAIARMAHALHGGSSQMGATILSETCGELEAVAYSADPTTISALVVAIRRLFDEAIGLLRERYLAVS